MAKRLFLLLFVSLIGVISTPRILAATDTVNLTRVSDARAVETVPLPEPEPEPEPVLAKAPASGRATSVQSEPVYTAPANNIAIAGRTIEIVDVSDTTVDAGGHVNKYGAKFLYGHNSAAVFGGIVNMGVGSTFSVTYGGVTTNYQVANVVIFEKNTDNGLLQLNGSGSFMNAVARAVHLGVHYDLSVMTCYGTSYGNGDASHRYVLFANQM